MGKFDKFVSDSQVLKQEELGCKTVVQDVVRVAVKVYEGRVLEKCKNKHLQDSRSQKKGKKANGEGGEGKGEEDTQANQNEDNVDDNKPHVNPHLEKCFSNIGTKVTQHAKRVVEYHKRSLPH